MALLVIFRLFVTNADLGGLLCIDLGSLQLFLLLLLVFIVVWMNLLVLIQLYLIFGLRVRVLLGETVFLLL